MPKVLRGAARRRGAFRFVFLLGLMYQIKFCLRSTPLVEWAIRDRREHEPFPSLSFQVLRQRVNYYFEAAFRAQTPSLKKGGSLETLPRPPSVVLDLDTEKFMSSLVRVVLSPLRRQAVPDFVAYEPQLMFVG